jgi:hypothetical protein
MTVRKQPDRTEDPTPLSTVGGGDTNIFTISKGRKLQERYCFLAKNQQKSVLTVVIYKPIKFKYHPHSELYHFLYY